jgi:UDP-2,4-diacetamido-2,4,6-trideoxy-beta-L-altropyranose hydrolase
MKQIVFRLDANTRIGTGHLMRCMTIADELDRQKYHIYFICGKITPPMQKFIADKGYKFYVEDNQNHILKIIETLKPDYLIIDHYGLDSKFETKARPYSKQIIVIDDMADRFHICDFLLDQGPLRTKDDYKPWVNPECQLLLGANYVLIKPEFRLLRKSCITSWEKGLISFGGSDPDNITLKILKALDCALKMKHIKWTIIAGAANQNWNSLRNFTNQTQMEITLIKQTNQIARLMSNHDFSFGAAGTMAWERACIGLPSITFAIAENQNYGIEVIRHFDLGETLDVSDISLNKLMVALNRLKNKANNYLHRNHAMVDGHGVKRLIAKLNIYS